MSLKLYTVSFNNNDNIIIYMNNYVQMISVSHSLSLFFFSVICLCSWVKKKKNLHSATCHRKVVSHIRSATLGIWCVWWSVWTKRRSMWHMKSRIGSSHTSISHISFTRILMNSECDTAVFFSTYYMLIVLWKQFTKQKWNKYLKSLDRWKKNQQHYTNNRTFVHGIRDYLNSQNSINYFKNN